MTNKFTNITGLSESIATAVKSFALEIVAVILVASGKSTLVKADPASATAPATVPLALLAVAAVKIAPNAVASLVVVTVTAIPSTSVIAPLAVLLRIFAEVSLNFAYVSDAPLPTSAT